MKLSGHVMSNSRAVDVLRALHEARYDVGARYLPRALKLLALNLPMNQIGSIEGALYGRRVRRTELAGPPVFILGHWRTGTTHIHNTMSRDPQFGYLSNFGAFATNNSLIGGGMFKGFVRSVTPEKRPMDDMSLDVDLPQEEEFAMSNLTHLSYYKQYTFPRLSSHYARRHIFFDDVPAAEIEAWKRTYDLLLRKATLLAGPRPLLLKNPPNTARLKHLLDLYPDAKVVYMFRDPYAVYLSTLRMRETVCAQFRLHDCDRAALSEHVLETYPRMVERFFADLPRVRPGNFVALGYHDLKAAPLASLERIYGALGLKGFGEARPRFAAYLDTVSEFRPATYREDPSIRALVESRWGATHARHEQFASA